MWKRTQLVVCQKVFPCLLSFPPSLPFHAMLPCWGRPGSDKSEVFTLTSGCWLCLVCVSPQAHPLPPLPLPTAFNIYSVTHRALQIMLSVSCFSRGWGEVCAWGVRVLDLKQQRSLVFELRGFHLHQWLMCAHWQWLINFFLTGEAKPESLAVLPCTNLKAAYKPDILTAHKLVKSVASFTWTLLIWIETE